MEKSLDEGWWRGLRRRLGEGELHHRASRRAGHHRHRGVYLWEFNPTAASFVVEEIYGCFPLLAEQPAMGHRRQDLTRLPVRFWTVRGRYLVVYRDQATPVEIARVLNGDRDIAFILEQS